MESRDNRKWTYDPSVHSRPQVSTSSRLTDTQRTHTTSSQSSVVTQPSRVQQQQPDIRTRYWYRRQSDIRSPSTRDVRFFRDTLRRTLYTNDLERTSHQLLALKHLNRPCSGIIITLTLEVFDILTTMKLWTGMRL